MKLLHHSEPDPTNTTNDDKIGWHATPTGIWLWCLDGATLPTDVPSCCNHTTTWYVKILDHALRTATSQPHTTPTDALAQAIHAVTQQHPCPDADKNGPSATAIIAHYQPPKITWALLGDNTLLIQDHAGHLQHHTDTRLSTIAINQRTALKNAHNQSKTSFHQKLILAERDARNRPGGYWIAAANPTAANHALTGTEHNPHTIALLTDGATRLIEFELTNWQGLLDTLTTHGPAHLIHQTRRAEHTDPNGQLWPRSKCHDDATVLLCQLN